MIMNERRNHRKHLRVAVFAVVILSLAGCGATFEPGADFAGQDYGPRAFLNVHWGDGSATPYDRFWDTSAYQMNDQCQMNDQ